MLTPIGWLDGLTALSVVTVGTILGLFSFYKSKKLKAKLLGISGLCALSISFTLLGPAVDLLVILLTGNNIEPFWLYGLLSYSWSAPITIFGLYIGGELIFPRKKWYILSIYIVLSVIFEVILYYGTFADPYTIFHYDAPVPPGSGLLNTSIVLFSPAFILMIIFLTSGLIFNGFGFLRKSIQSSGVLKRNFLYLSLGWFFFIICGLLDGVFDPGVITFFVRTGTILSVIFMYVGVRIK